MSKDQYLEMCEQMGEEPNWERCPPAWEDFPQIIVDTVNIFNSLGDRVYPDIGYVGKDFTNLNFLFELYKINLDIEKDWIFELLLFMDKMAIEESQQQIKEQLSKMKSKK